MPTQTIRRAGHALLVPALAALTVLAAGPAAAQDPVDPPGDVVFGTQTLGSVIRPAAFCGVVGYKPSFGAISRNGIHPFSPTLDTVGVFARSVADAAWFGACLMGQDNRDEATYIRGPLSTLHVPLEPLAGPPRLAIVRTPKWSITTRTPLAHSKGAITGQWSSSA